jgi:hypothetical protein
MKNSHVRNIPKMQGETRLSPHPRPLMWQMPLWGLYSICSYLGKCEVEIGGYIQDSLPW